MWVCVMARWYGCEWRWREMRPAVQGPGSEMNDCGEGLRAWQSLSQSSAADALFFA